MVSCKDCIQYDVCDCADGRKYADVESLKKDCPSFKNKFDFVKVVRCKDCMHYMEMEGYDYKSKKARCCIWHNQLRRETDYCSDGIGKGGEGDG